jgi:hypothetical protein
MAEPWPRRAGGIQAATGAESEVISVPKVLSADDVARWTRVVPSFVGHENICKPQRTVMTL